MKAARGVTMAARWVVRTTFVCASIVSTAWADEPEGADRRFTLSGYGTLGAVHSSQREADFVNTVTQPDGAGHTRPISIDTDSRLGVQLEARLTSRTAAVVQVVAKQGWDNSYAPTMEWAYLKHRVTDDWEVRAGRFASPSLIASDYRLVGYAQPWVRPPVDVYSGEPTTNLDGVDTLWRVRGTTLSNALQVMFGRNSLRFATGSSRVDDTLLVADSLEYRSLTLHGSYTSARLLLDFPAATQLLDGLHQFGSTLAAIPGLGSYAAQSLALEQAYRTTASRAQAFALGVTYDADAWLVMSEYFRLEASGYLGRRDAAYLTVGRRIGAWTPFVSAARLRVRSPDLSPIPTEGLPAPLDNAAAQLNGGLQSLRAMTGARQDTVSLGVRWDLRKDMDLKFQYDRIALQPGSFGQLVDAQPGLQPGATVHLFSIALDFVF